MVCARAGAAARTTATRAHAGAAGRLRFTTDSPCSGSWPRRARSRPDAGTDPLNPSGFSDLLMQIPGRVTVLSSDDVEIKEIRDRLAGDTASARHTEGRHAAGYWPTGRERGLAGKEVRSDPRFNDPFVGS